MQRLLTFRISHEHIGAISFRVPSGAESVCCFPLVSVVQALFTHAFRNVRSRTNGDEHALAVERKGDIARAMSPAALGQLGHDHLGCAAGVQVARLVRKTNDRIVVRDVEPLGMISGRIKSNAERPVEMIGENLVLRGRLGSVGGPQHTQAIGGGLSQENVAIGRDPQQARIGQAADKKLHREVRRDGELGVRRRLHNFGSIPGGGRAVGRGQIRDGKMMLHPGRGIFPIAGTGLGLHRCHGGHTGRGYAPGGKLQRGEVGDQVGPVLRFRHHHRHGRAWNICAGIG